MKDGESDLRRLVAEMQPVLTDDEYVFCVADREALGSLGYLPVCTFREEEGLTAILPAVEAEHLGYSGSFPCRMITLTIHSSLEAVGLLALVTGRLAEAGISVNAVSAYYHDHLFVPQERAQEALSILRQLSDEARF
jgi:hypothetical protein